MHKSWPNGSAAWGLMFVGTLASANTGATHWQDHHRLLPFHHRRIGIVIGIVWNATKSIIDRFAVDCLKKVVKTEAAEGRRVN